MIDKKLKAKIKYGGLKPSEPLIFDRTVDDVAQKGYYNLGDLQRIQAWIRYGAELSEEAIEQIPFTDGETITRERFEQVLNDINTLIQKVYEGHDKTPPTMPIAIAWDWRKANEAERILQLATDFLYSELNDSIFAVGAFHYDKFGGSLLYHPQYVAPMHVFPREKPEEVEKPTCTFVLVSLSGKEIQYEVELNSWFLIPPYDEIFPNDGTIDEWNEQERGKRRLDMAYVFVKSPDWHDSGVYEEGGTYYFYAINRAMVQRALTNCTFELAEDGSHITVKGIPEIIQRQFSNHEGRFEYRGFCVRFFRVQHNSVWRGEQTQNVQTHGMDTPRCWKRKIRTSFDNNRVDKDVGRIPNYHGEVAYTVPWRTVAGDPSSYNLVDAPIQYDFRSEIDLDIPTGYGSIYQFIRDFVRTKYERGCLVDLPKYWTVGWQLMTGDGKCIGILGAKREIKIKIRD